MAKHNDAPWVRYGAMVTIFLFYSVLESAGQQFVDPQVQSYPLQNVTALQVEQSLRDFLAPQIESGAAVDVISDPHGDRILVRGSQEVQRSVAQYIAIVDKKPQLAANPFAQATRIVKPYRVDDAAELQRRAIQLRQVYEERADVRIAADERTRQLIVHAPQEVHDQIANWFQQSAQVPTADQENSLPPATAVANTPSNPQNVPPQQFAYSGQIPLKHIDWRTLVQGMRGVQGGSAAITSPREGELQMTLPSESGVPVQMQIDQQNQLVQIRGDQESTERWTRVVQALDQQPTQAGESQATGRLGDAKADTITQTIAMLGGAGAFGPSTLRTADAQRANWGGDVVNQLFQRQRQPLQLAQAGQLAPAPDDEEARVLGSDDGGNFLGPVRIEFLDGTDIFIIRGAQRDLDRVMKIINEIEAQTKETEPSIEIFQLQHANSEAVRDLINELNSGVLEARLGDVSITALVKPNAVLLIGRPAGVESVKDLIRKLDVPAEASARFRVFGLKYLPAVDAERTINFLYNQQQQQQQTAGTGSTLTPRVRAVADFRSNSIVVQGSPRDIEEIANLLKQIDQEGGTSANEVRVFALKNAIAEEVATVLDDTLGTDQSSQAQQGQTNFGGQQTQNTQTANTQARSSRRAMTLRMKVLDEKTNRLLDNKVLESGILSNVVVTFNERTNTVIVTAPASGMDLIAEIIRQLDERPSQEAQIRVITVINGDGQTLVDMLDSLFPQDANQNGPVVQSAAGTSDSTLVPLRFALDPRTNSIIVTGNEADLGVVEAILLKLDANDVNRRRNFVYELLYQQATVVADAITQYVQQKRTAFTSIAPDALSPYQLIDQEIVAVGEDVSNKVIVSVSPRFYDEVMELLQNLDKRPDMVMVKCLIAEVDLGTAEEFGVELGIQDSLLFNRSAAGVPGFAFNNVALGNNATALGAARDQVAGQALSSFGLGRSNTELGYGGLVLSASNESISVLLRALQQARRLDILSRPQVMMLNNQIGEVQVGASVPFIGDTNTNGLTTTNSVEFIEVGLILSVVPRISPDGLVVMNVLADKSELGSIEEGIPISISANGDVLRQPQINRSRAETIVSARDGQTVILGGLITKDRTTSERKVPYLADVPLLGKLFRSESIVENRSELLIILTPYVVRDDSDLQRVNSEEYARMSWCLGNVLETHGEIKPLDDVLEGDVLYEELTPHQEQLPVSEEGVPEEAPSLPTLPGSVMQPIRDSLQPVPVVKPPVPNMLPESLPQAKSQMQLNAPRAARSTQVTTIRPVGAELTKGARSVRNLGQLEDEGQEEAKPALFRFEEIPSFGIVK